MVVLISGGAGYLGNILVQKLLAAGTRKRENNNIFNSDYGSDSHNLEVDEVIVYDNLMYKQTCLLDQCYRESFNFVLGDVRDENKFKKYINKADVIIPLAAIVGMPACEKDKQLATQVNYEQIKFILENTTKDQKILYPNTNSGYGIGENNIYCTEESPLNPISHYGITKCNAEKLLLDSGRALCFRLATVFGASSRMRLDLLINDFVYKAMNDKYIVLFEKQFKRNYIHIRDIALTFVYMINNYDKYVGNVFNVGLSSANLSKFELTEKIKEYITDFVIKDEEFSKDPDQRDYIVSNEKIEKTGWKTYYSIDDGIKELIKVYTIILNNNKMFTNL